MYKIAVIPGDGIGPEVTEEGIKVLEALAADSELEFEFEYFNLGADHYLETGELVTDEVKEELAQFDAIYLGAVGDPRVEPGVLEKGILLDLRFTFDQYINLRPIKLLNEDFTPLKDKAGGDIDFTVVRENTEGLYAGFGGVLKKDTPDEVATQEMVNTRKGVERVIRYAFDYVQDRDEVDKVTVCDKRNVLTYAHGLWQRAFDDVAKDYPEVEEDHMLVDAMTMKMVRNPEDFDVVVTCNMFGDIITDLGAEIQGGMGLAVSGNINPDGVSMFEPVHGSAPDIAGEDIANPTAAILAAAMMVEVLGHAEEADRIETAVQQALTDNKTTSDMGGDLSTAEAGDYISSLL
ncbi:3-isopropylmalate dehydrogenase [Acetohalobium arabaticum]|uniref:3-isopropylmalate dehydrogenase n=1 Tax=Acetohalobium arabaticum (strain ATCC 49924 / DSM 5501 / Z-7288) TaxID=574087 RepID=D9QTJ8_ACEAZ|nr:3-isopropylmalate dehydrogenase [Acetohalobium arabaticum]ADL11762.1 3-isopropylmalate dehydrogenase [Acetohalobium arabaticum DSM 5501]